MSTIPGPPESRPGYGGDGASKIERLVDNSVRVQLFVLLVVALLAAAVLLVDISSAWLVGGGVGALIVGILAGAFVPS